MAYQSFFAKSDNGKRQTPAQCSGKNVYSEFRCRVNGDSQLVLNCRGIDNEDGTLTTTVYVYDPNTGDIVFKLSFKTPK